MQVRGRASGAVSVQVPIETRPLRSGLSRGMLGVGPRSEGPKPRLPGRGLRANVDKNVDTNKKSRVAAARKPFEMNGGAEEDRTPDL